MFNNKIKVFFVVLYLISFLFVSPVTLTAVDQANNNEVRMAQKKICLKGAGTGDLGKTVSIVPSTNMTVDLTGSGFGDANAVYVALCLPSDQKTVCTTGNPELDKEIFGADFSKDLQNLEADAGTWSGYKYGTRNTGSLSINILKNKIKPTGGKISTTVSINNALGHFVYPFYGFYQSPTIMLETGRAAGDQQGTFTFDDMNSNCTSILWDPYGRIFDSQSLEPIPNVNIKVLTAITPTEKLAQIYGNPQSTIEDGAFNFLVEPGTYYLRLVNTPAKYTFRSEPNLNPNYYKAYSKRDGTTSIYKPDEPIIEKPKKPEHRDIPLDPGKNPAGHYPVVNIISNGFNQMASGESTEYGGKISHPLSMVALVGQKTKNEIARISADKFGYWAMSVENKLIPQNEPLLTRLIKVDLTTMRPDEANGRTTYDVVFYPLPRQIQGYASLNGKTIPNAKVAIVLENNNKTFYETTADLNGLISVSTDKLPIFPFNLTIKAPGSTVAVKQTFDVFAQENADFLEKNSINLMMQDSNTKNQQTTGQKNANTISAKTGQNVDYQLKQNNGAKPNAFTGKTTPGKTGSSDLSNNNPTSNNNLLVIIITAILVFAAVAGTAVWLVIKRNKQNQFTNFE